MSLSKRLKRFLPEDYARRKRLSSIAITVTLHGLLWLSIATVVLGGLMLQKPMDGVLIPSASLALFAGSVSLFYIILHTIFSWRRKHGKDSIFKTTFRYKRPLYAGARTSGLVAIIWLITAAWCIIIAARNPICLPVTRSRQASWEAGPPCLFQRITTGVSFVALIVSCILFGLISYTRSPFDSNLFGRIDIENVYPKEIDTQSFSSSEINQIRPPSPIITTPTTPVTPPPAVTEVFSRPGTSMSQIVRPTRYHSSRNGSQISISAPNNTRVIHRSASESSLRHPAPIRRIPSASNLTMHHPQSVKQPHQHGYHQRSISAGATPYPQYPSAAVVAAQYRLPPSQRLDYNTALFRNSAKAFQAPSAWSAIHPPTHHFRHTKSTSSLRALAQSNGSTASFATIRQLPQSQNPYLSHMHARHARTAGSASSYSSRSGGGGGHGVPISAQSWAGGYTRGMTFASSRSTTPLHRKTSSHSSSTGSASGLGKGSLTSEVLKEVDEDALVSGSGDGSSSGSGNGSGSANTPATSVSTTNVLPERRSRSPPRQASGSSASRSESASRSPPASRSASASGRQQLKQQQQQHRDRSTSRSRSPSLSRSVTPSNIIDSYMYRSGTPVMSHAPGGQMIQSRVSPEGEIRKLRKARSDVDLQESIGRQHSGSRSRKGKGKQVIVHL